MSTDDTAGTGRILTTQTTTRAVWNRTRKNGGWLPVALGAVGLAALALVHGTTMRQSIEGNLHDRTVDALKQVGLSCLDVSFTGRDATISGTLPAGVDATKVISAAEGVDGVRMATFTTTPGGGGTSPASPSVLPAAGALPKVTAKAADGKVVLTGTVPSKATSDALAAAAGSVYGVPSAACSTRWARTQRRLPRWPTARSPSPAPSPPTTPARRLTGPVPRWWAMSPRWSTS
jgi:BON domain